GVIEKPIPYLLYFHLIGYVGKHCHAPFGEHHHTAGARSLMAPAIFSFSVEIESVPSMLHRRYFVACPDQLRYHPFNQRRFSAIRPTDKRKDRYGHTKKSFVMQHHSIVYGCLRRAAYYYLQQHESR